MYEPKIDPRGESAQGIEDVIGDLAQTVGEVNVANGWDTSRDMAADPRRFDPRHVVSHQIAQLALIGTEVSEAIEELRKGYAIHEMRYSGSKDSPYDERESFNSDGSPRKPEGIPSELADIVIRTLDFADAYGINLGAAIIEKLNHNATRGNRHGGKTI